jgi:hypothetical protein
MAGSFAAPLREHIAAVSFGATVVGKMHTTGLKGQPLAAIPSELREEWLEDLRRAIEAVEAVGVGLSQASLTLRVLQ